MDNICFIGGDSRNKILFNLFKEKNRKVCEYGLTSIENCVKENIQEMKNMIQGSKYIITSIPFSKDKININSKYAEISIENFIKFSKNKIIYTGSMDSKTVELLEKNNNVVIDVIKDPDFAIKNAIPTAEGVIKIIIENTDITIWKSNIALIGFGRVGKRIAEVLNKLGANIWCYDIKKEEVANIKMCGYNVLKDICESLEQKDIIINTVPETIIKEQNLKYISKDSLIVDVASESGGIDFKYAEINNYKCIHALGLPGNIAPKSAASYIKEIMEKYENMRC